MIEEEVNVDRAHATLDIHWNECFWQGFELWRSEGEE